MAHRPGGEINLQQSSEPNVVPDVEGHATDGLQVSESSLTRKVYKIGSTQITVTLFNGEANDQDGKEVLLRDVALLVITNPAYGDERYVLIPGSKCVDPVPSEEDRSFSAQGRQFALKWPLEKLGDGSYGIVYKAYERNRKHEPLALKILYERQLATRTGLMSISGNHLQGIRKGEFGKSTQDTDRETRPTHFSAVIGALMEGLANRIAQASRYRRLHGRLARRRRGREVSSARLWPRE